jgi:hypothetical protein
MHFSIFHAGVKGKQGAKRSEMNRIGLNLHLKKGGPSSIFKIIGEANVILETPLCSLLEFFFLSIND